MEVSEPIRIRPATADDTVQVLEFIRALAVFEDHLEHFEATAERLSEQLFGSNPKAEVLLAFQGEQPIGFAVYYYTFSSFAGLPGLYLEDLFVKREVRGKGVGRALLAKLAQIAKQENCWRIEWEVLNRNETAIRFYENLGAVPKNEWTVYRLAGEPLERLAQEAKALPQE